MKTIENTENRLRKFREKEEPFLNIIFRSDFWIENENTGKKLQTLAEKHIPLLGYVYKYRRSRKNFENANNGLCRTDIYMVTLAGKMQRPNKEIDFSKPDQDIIESVANFLTGIPKSEIIILKSKEPCELSSLQWKIICISEKSFLTSLEESKIGCVVAEISSPEKATRYILPSKVEIKGCGELNFSLEKEKVRFMCIYPYATEYITESGIRVYDNRIQGVPFEKITIDKWLELLRFETNSPLVTRIKNRKECPLRIQALYNWMQTIRPKEIVDKKHMFAWHMLEKLAVGLMPNDSDDFGSGLEIFTGSKSIPASKIFKNCRWEIRFSVSYNDWQRNPFFPEDKFNPYYVVITDGQKTLQEGCTEEK